MKRKVVLITGSSGLIGRNIVEHLETRNWETVGFSKSHPYYLPTADRKRQSIFSEIAGDVRDADAVSKALQQVQPTHLIHLAAQPLVGNALRDSEDTFDTNIRGSWTILEAAKQYGKLESIIIASSDKAYGRHDALPYKEEYELKARNPYDISKQATEQLAMCYFHTFGLPITITRCGNTFGPHDLNLSRIVPGTIVSALQDQEIVLRSSGLNKRCYVYAKDVAMAYAQILEAPASLVSGEAFNVGSGNVLTAREIAEKIRSSITGCSSPIVVENTSRGEIEHQSLDSDKITTVLGWEPRWELDRAIAETVSWYREALEYFTSQNH